MFKIFEMSAIFKMAAKTWHKILAVKIQHWKISTGRHNTAKIQHCPISSKFDMWVDNDVPNWFPTSENFYRLPFSKWPPQYCTNSTLSDFNDISYVGRLWCPELIPDIEKFLPVTIFKMATTILHKFNIIQFHRPELIPDIEKIQHCSISKVAFNLFFKPVVCGRFGRLHNR